MKTLDHTTPTLLNEDTTLRVIGKMLGIDPQALDRHTKLSDLATYKPNLEAILTELEHHIQVELNKDPTTLAGIETIGDLIRESVPLGYQFLNVFYKAHHAKTTEEKIKALRDYFIREPMMVTVDNSEQELLAIEFYILMHYGFN